MKLELNPQSALDPPSKGMPTVEAGCSSVTIIQADVLFGESNTLFIDLRGERYQLRRTRNGKLILTK
jgi:hemin uptake protein HemP